jgi:branched-chain amino acid transport system substrate-binding protein
MMNRRGLLKGVGGLLGAVALDAKRATAQAKPLKLGLIVSSSGPSASNAIEFTTAIKAFMAKHGDSVAGRKIEILQRDGMGPSPDVNVRLTQELITRQGVDIMFGYDYTPSVLAVKKISTEARMPTLIVNAATSGILRDAPYMVRFGLTTAQITEPLAKWLPTTGAKRAYALFANYGPGLEARTTFKEGFVKAGGEYMGEIPVPASNPDFSGYLQRIKEAKPDALFVFLPTGDQPVAFLKATRDYDLAGAGIKIVGLGDIASEDAIDAIGDSIVGVTTTFGYSDVHKSPENEEFVRLFKEAGGSNTRPNFLAAVVWDVMGAIYNVVAEQGGNVDPDKTMALLQSYKTMGPRGPISINPETRDAIATVYLRTAKKVGGLIVNEEFASFPDVPSPAMPVH